MNSPFGPSPRQQFRLIKTKETAVVSHREATIAEPPKRRRPGPASQPGIAPTTAPREQIPAYLRDTYTWAYLSRLGTRLFDRQPVVNAILWGNARRLIAWVLRDLQPGWRVMQPAAVYGTFSRDIAHRLGPDGHLEVSDVAPVQVALTRRKLGGCANTAVHRCDATTPGRGPYDAVTCFFLLHEVPNAYKADIVDALLGAVKPGGKAIFVDYHRPARLHPLRPIMHVVFDILEPYAKDLWTTEIAEFTEHAEAFSWHKETMFGGLYQKVVATRRP